jgi:hypothetical protein
VRQQALEQRPLCVFEGTESRGPHQTHADGPGTVAAKKPEKEVAIACGPQNRLVEILALELRRFYHHLRYYRHSDRKAVV